MIGIDDPEVDVEIIELLWGFCRDLGLRDIRLLVNSMGDAETRTRYREVLLAYWRAHAALLGAEMERAEANPLRILDSKRPDWSEMLEHAPQLGEYLSDASAAHFARVQEGLQALGIPFEIAPRLVRGFDYYTATVFELASDALDAAQNAIGGGGRYDKLARGDGRARGAVDRIRFGYRTPAARVRRRRRACPSRRRASMRSSSTSSGSPTLRACSPSYASPGLSADRAYGGRSPKKQFTAADRSGARWAVIIGADEMKRGMVAVKDLRSDEPQSEVRREEIAAWLRTRKDEARS